VQHESAGREAYICWRVEKIHMYYKKATETQKIFDTQQNHEPSPRARQLVKTKNIENIFGRRMIIDQTKKTNNNNKTNKNSIWKSSRSGNKRKIFLDNIFLNLQKFCRFCVFETRFRSTVVKRRNIIIS